LLFCKESLIRKPVNSLFTCFQQVQDDRRHLPADHGRPGLLPAAGEHFPGHVQAAHVGRPALHAALAPQDGRRRGGGGQALRRSSGHRGTHALHVDLEKCFLVNSHRHFDILLCIMKEFTLQIIYH